MSLFRISATGDGRARTVRTISARPGSPIRASNASSLALVRALEAKGYLNRNGSGGYVLVSQRASSLPDRLLRLMQTAPPTMMELGRELRATVVLAALLENHIEIIAAEEGSDNIGSGGLVGRIVPPHASAAGKAIAAFQPRGRADILLRAFGLLRFAAGTITGRAEIDREFARVRRTGVAAEHGEWLPGMSGFAAPIPPAHGEVDAAIGATASGSELFGEAAQARFIQAIRSAATVISSEANTRISALGGIPAQRKAG